MNELGPRHIVAGGRAAGLHSNNSFLATMDSCASAKCPLTLFQIAVSGSVTVGACVSGPHFYVGSGQSQGPLAKQCVKSVSAIP